MSPWPVTFALFFQVVQMELPNVAANPHTTPADIEQGRKLFAGRCAGCHGPGGDGGKGANLAVPQLERASTDLALYRVVRYGLPETEMPATLLSTKEVWQITAFVRTLGRAASSGGGAAPSGNAMRGAELARGAKGGCLTCHAIGLDGGRLGPALTDIGARRGAAHLRAKLLNAASDIPDTFRMVELTTTGGRKLSGVRLNEDVHSIQLRDFSANIHSLWKKDVSALKVERRTPMPSYQGKLSAQELDDMIAFLLSLRGGAQ